LVGAAGEILLRAGYFEDQLAALEIAVRSARTIGNRRSESSMLGNLGQTRLMLGDFDTAEADIQASDIRAQEIGYQIGSAVANYHLARLHVERGEFERGIQLHLAALNMLRRSGARGLDLVVIYKLCEAYRRAGNLHAAMATCRDGLLLAEQLGDHHAQALVLTEFGMSYYEFGDLTTAKDHSERALEIHERLRDVGQAGKTYNLLCAIHRDEGSLDEAEHCAREALTRCRTARDARGQALAYDAIGQLQRDRAQADEAREAWSHALAILDDLGDPLAGSVRARLAELTELPPPVPTTRTEPVVPDRQTSA
jgi:tetratricopeptide (TPR) repeat protein